jgi:hypothetical protein
MVELLALSWSSLPFAMTFPASPPPNLLQPLTASWVNGALGVRVLALPEAQSAPLPNRATLWCILLEVLLKSFTRIIAKALNLL